MNHPDENVPVDATPERKPRRQASRRDEPVKITVTCRMPDGKVYVVKDADGNDQPLPPEVQQAWDKHMLRGQLCYMMIRDPARWKDFQEMAIALGVTLPSEFRGPAPESPRE